MKTLKLIEKYTRILNEQDPGTLPSAEGNPPADATAPQPEGDATQPTENKSITSEEIVNLVNTMKDFIINVGTYGVNLTREQLLKLESDSITPENALEKLQEYTSLVSQKQPDQGIDLQK